MAWYKISYKTATGKLISGIREYHLKNIDDTYDIFLAKAKQAGEITEFNCVMISTKSDEFKAHMAAKERRRFNNTGTGDSRTTGPGKYRKKGDGPELGSR
jgi:hypothetical protein